MAENIPHSHDEWNYFKDVVDFLYKYRWVYNINMTKVFCSDILHNIPQNWKDALLQLSCDEMNNVPYGFRKDSWPLDLKEFLIKGMEFGAYRFQQNEKTSIDILVEVPSSLKCGMSPKKLKEVIELAKEINNVCQLLDCSAVLDIGSGLGYLGQVLHANFGYFILGVESDAGHCEKARQRQKVMNCPNIQSETYHLFDNDKEIGNILDKIIEPIPCSCSKKQVVPTKDNGWVIVGLHACGSLTPAILELYSNNPYIKGLICVGCCYHKQYESATSNFPLSQVLKTVLNTSDTDWHLTQGLRLAAQETKSRWKVQSDNDHKRHVTHVAYRGVVEYYLSQLDTSISTFIWNKPSRRMPKSAFVDFETYCETAFQNQSEFLQENKIKLIEMYEKLETFFPLLEILTLLQVMLQPVWESLILKDRCHYLGERGFNSDVKIFVNDCISPRNSAIISTKIKR